MRKAALLLFTVVFPLFMLGCGGQSSSVTTPPATSSTPASVPVSLSVTDTPPNGVTVLFFQLTITGAALTTSSGGSVSLLSSTNPIPVNVSQLLTDSAFLASANVTAGKYTGLSVTFANPQLTIFNGSDSALASTCAINTVCQLTPTTTTGSSLTLNFTTSPPFPVDLSASSPLAFKLDIHLDTIIQPDLSVDLSATNGVTISQLPTPRSGTPVPGLGHLTGTIQSVNSSTSPNGFTLQTLDGRTLTIDVSSGTTYENFPSSSTCTTESFSCLATQEVVKVEVSLQTDGTLLASDVDFVQVAGQTVVEGTIIRLSTSGGNTLMDLILQKGPTAPSTLPLGHRVTVTVPASGVTYAIDSGTFTLPTPSGYVLSFANATDLTVGQEVSVVVQGSVTPASGSSNWTPWSNPGAATFTTNSITLEPSQVTGSVAATNASALSFTLSTMPKYFTPPAAASTPPAWAPVNITVLTTAATTFSPSTLTPDTIAGLNVNDVVSVEGWVFSTPSGTTTITLAAETVLDRGSVTALF